MNIFKSRTLSWWQVGALKACLYCIGISVGAYWSAFFLPYITYLLGIGAILAVYLVHVWFRD